MDITTEIAERYKKMSNSELLEVLQNPSLYQPIAISIAKLEFTSRNLSEIEINEAKQVIVEKNIKREKRNEKFEVAKTKLIETSDIIYDTINPIEITSTTTKKYILLITVIFTVLFIYKITSNSDLLIAILKGDSYESFGYTLYFFPLLFEIVSVITFWLKKQIGWILLVAFCSYSLIEVLYALYYSISLQFRENNFSDYFPTPSPTAYIISILFYVGTLFVLNKQDIKEVFDIDRSKVQNSLIIGTLVGVLFLFILFYS